MEGKTWPKGHRHSVKTLAATGMMAIISHPSVYRAGHKMEETLVLIDLSLF